MRVIDEHEYGNGTCVFTRDGEAARYFADNINVGMVGINVPLPVPAAYHSFGGWESLPIWPSFCLRPRQRALLHASQNDQPVLAVASRTGNDTVHISELKQAVAVAS